MAPVPISPQVAGLLVFSGAAVTQLVKSRLSLNKSYLRSLRHLSVTGGGPRSIPLAASEDDDDRFAKRRQFFEKFVAQQGLHQAHFRFIHVAGTKGKGTVCELLRCGLIANGRRVGTFTSPHLHSARERIRIDNRCIPEGDFARLWQHVQAAFKAEDTTSWAVFFDKVLALALAFFIQEKVEYVILEVGIGGRYDSTNFITDPAACVVTSVSLDHVDMLGDRLEMIAWQKAGIFKPHCLALTSAEQDPAVLHVLQREAAAQRSTLILVDPCSVAREACHVGATWLQRENVALAKRTLEALGFEARGFDKAYWPARFEALPLSPKVTVVVDAAHNRASVAKTLAEARERFPGWRVVCVFGSGSDKDCDGMLGEIDALAHDLLLVQAPHPRAVPVAQLHASALSARVSGKQRRGQGRGCERVRADSPKVGEALELAIGEATRRAAPTVIVAFGSFYVASGARAWLAEQQPWLFRPDDWAFHSSDVEEGPLPRVLKMLGVRHLWRRARVWGRSLTNRDVARLPPPPPDMRRGPG